MINKAKIKDQRSKLEEILEVTFKHEELLTQALTHRSYLNEDSQVKVSNERLEFLGDSVLQLLTSRELFNRFPDLPEGKLTSLRSNLVRTETLANLAESLSLGDYLLLSRGEKKEGGQQNRSLLANTFEAVLGAIYLDQGLEKTREFLEKNLFPQIVNLEKTSPFDFKSKLQEVIQGKMHLTPTYKVVAQEGPDHDKIFTVAVILGKKARFTVGQGKSKQEAQQAAAKTALEKISAPSV